MLISATVILIMQTDKYFEMRKTRTSKHMSGREHHGMAIPAYTAAINSRTNGEILYPGIIQCIAYLHHRTALCISLHSCNVSM